MKAIIQRKLFAACIAAMQGFSLLIVIWADFSDMYLKITFWLLMAGVLYLASSASWIYLHVKFPKMGRAKP